MQSEKFEDITQLPLKMEKGDILAKECKWLLEARKGKEMDSPLELPEGMKSY